MSSEIFNFSDSKKLAPSSLWGTAASTELGTTCSIGLPATAGAFRQPASLRPASSRAQSEHLFQHFSLCWRTLKDKLGAGSLMPAKLYLPTALYLLLFIGLRHPFPVGCPQLNLKAGAGLSRVNAYTLHSIRRYCRT